MGAILEFTKESFIGLFAGVDRLLQGGFGWVLIGFYMIQSFCRSLRV